VKPLGPEEEGARAIVEQTLGLSVFQHDDGSDDGMYDLKVVRDGSIVAALEVTIAADQKSIELSVPLSRLASLHGGVWTDGRLRGGWLVTVDAARTRVKDLSSELPMLLAELEATNRPSLDREYDSEADAWPRRLMSSVCCLHGRVVRQVSRGASTPRSTLGASPDSWQNG